VHPSRPALRCEERCRDAYVGSYVEDDVAFVYLHPVAEIGLLPSELLDLVVELRAIRMRSIAASDSIRSWALPLGTEVITSGLGSVTGSIDCTAITLRVSLPCQPWERHSRTPGELRRQVGGVHSTGVPGERPDLHWEVGFVAQGLPSPVRGPVVEVADDAAAVPP
jgi:hypothetical protein